MIGRLHGLILEKHPPHLLLDVNGVGYEIEAPMTTFYKLPEVGAEVRVYTHLVVREDAQLLFGFASEAERRLFRALIRVNGVGAKLALTILSGIETADFVHCIRAGDSDRLVKLPGIGRKTAERLIVEMRDRLQGESGKQFTAEAGGIPGPAPSSAADEAVSALVSLGYKPQEASRYVLEVAIDEMSSEEIIRAALKASVHR